MDGPTYLLFEMCLVRPDEIGDDMPTRWNHLETYVPGETALTHFTVVPTQPWKTDATPLNELWMRAYEDAVAAGAVDPQHVRDGIQKGYYKRGLAAALASMAGDLWESALKRRYGVKDAGKLIPGHGGLLDRVDGLMFAVVVVACGRLIVGMTGGAA